LLLLSTALCGAFWVLGLAQYRDNYCVTRAPLPAGEPGEVRTAYLDGPLTIRCEWLDPKATIEIFDPFPLLFGAFMALPVAGVSFVTFRWARGR
jgi:hypothetical protein